MRNLAITDLKSFSTWTRMSIAFANDKLGHRNVLPILRVLSYLQVIVVMLEDTSIQQKSPKHPLFFQEFFNRAKDAMNFTYGTYSFTTGGSVLAFLLILTAYFVFLAYGMIKTYLAIKKNSFNSRLIQLCSLIMTYHAEVFLYPICFHSMQLLKSISSSDVELETPTREISIGFTVFFLCCNAAIACYKIIFCYSCTQAKGYISRKGHFHLVGIATLKIILPIFHLLSHINGDGEYENGIFQVLDVLFCLLISVCIFLYTKLKLPEYDLRITKIQTIFESIALALSVDKTITLLTDDKQAVFIPTVLILPLWIKLNLYHLNVYLKRFKINPERSFSINYICHLESIFKDLENNITMNLASARFKPTLLDEKWLFDKDLEEATAESASEKTKSDLFQIKYRLYLEKCFESFFQRNSRNVLGLLSYAQLLSESHTKYAKAYDLCLKASRQRICTPQLISIHIILNQMQKALQVDEEEENNQHASKNVFSETLKIYFAAEDSFKRLHSFISGYVSQSVSFWQGVRGDKPDIQAVLMKAKLLERQRHLIESQWRRSEMLFLQNFPLAYLLYGVLQARFLNLPFKGQQNINKYHLLAKSQMVVKNIATQDMREYGVITISGQKESLGKVISYSEMTARTFGIDKDVLVGQNIKLIMPRFFQEKHDQILMNHYERGTSSIMNKEVKICGKDDKDNIFSVSLTITMQISLQKGVIYSSLIKKVEDEKEYILFAEDGEIEETSELIGKMLNIRPYAKMNINQLLPKVTEDSDTSDVETPSETDNNLTDEKIEAFSKKSSFAIPQVISIKNYEDDKEKVWHYETNVSYCVYLNKKLNVMTLKPQGGRLQKVQTERKLRSERRRSTRIININDAPDSSRNGRILDMETGLTSARKIKGNMVSERFGTERGLLEKGNKHEDSFEIFNSDIEFETLENKKEMEKRKLSAGKRVSSIGTSSQKDMIDHFQEIYYKSRPARMKKIMIVAFILILATCITVTGIQYIILKNSVKSIDFTVNVVKASYERLNSLSFIWRYSVTYKTRIDRIAPTSNLDLNRYKTLIEDNRELIKEANDALISAVTVGREDQQQIFFQKNIRFIYINDTAGLQERMVNSFEAINTFIEKLIRFDITPHATLFANGNPDLEFVRINAINDLLVSCENLVQIVEQDFSREITTNKAVMSLIYVLNILIGLVLGLLLVINFYTSYKENGKLFKAFLSINETSVDLLISKLNYFEQVIGRERQFLAQGLLKLNLAKTSGSQVKDIKLSTKEYSVRRLVIMKLKQNLLSTFMICCISLMCTLGFAFYNSLFNKLLDTHYRVILSEKGRFNVNLAYASLYDVIGNLNTTYVRNEPVGNQTLEIIEAIVSSPTLFSAFTGKDGKLIDPQIEQLFKEHPCSLVVDFPGSSNSQSCPRATQNDQIGMLAVNSKFYSDMVILSREMLGNLTFAKSKQFLPVFTGAVTTQTSTLIGAYMFLSDLMTQKYEDQMMELLSKGENILIFELLFMSLGSVICVWHLVKKVLDNSFVPILLKMTPHEEFTRNKLLQSVIKQIYRGRAELLHMTR